MTDAGWLVLGILIGFLLTLPAVGIAYHDGRKES